MEFVRIVLSRGIHSNVWYCNALADGSQTPVTGCWDYTLYEAMYRVLEALDKRGMVVEEIGYGKRRTRKTMRAHIERNFERSGTPYSKGVLDRTLGTEIPV